MAIREEFGLSLFGFDVIVPVRTGTYTSGISDSRGWTGTGVRMGTGMGTGRGVEVGVESGSSSSSSNNNDGNGNDGSDDDCDCDDIGGEKSINSVFVRVCGGGAVVEEEVSPYNNKNTGTASSGNGISDGYGNINRKDNGFESNKYPRNGQNNGFSVNGFAVDTHHSQNSETREKKEVEKEVEVEEGQECGHLRTLDRIESNQVNSKTSHLPASLESCSPSDPRSSSSSSSSSSCTCTITSEAVYNTHSDTQHTHMIPKIKICACGSNVLMNPEKEKEEIEIKREEDEHKYENKDKNKNQDENEEEKGDDDGDFELVVIDVNYFPSYKEVPDFPRRLRKFLRQKAGMPVYT
jgi:hypothetical protein